MNRRCILVFLAVGQTLTVVPVASGDSWAQPAKWEFTSENGKFVVVIDPASTGSNATATVLGQVGNERKQVWICPLSNRVMPTMALVSDNGHYVVTLDNWGRIGYGDDVVAIYDARGQIRKYSLEAFAPPPAPPAPPSTSIAGEFRAWLESIFSPGRGTRGRAGDSGYHGKFSHSTSSRHWRADSIWFFWPETNAESFCLWLDWDQKWVSWRLKSGRLEEPSQWQIRDWNAAGRRRALAEVKSGKATESALNFLGRLLFKEDRMFVEAWLSDGGFYGGSRQSSFSDSDEIRFAIFGQSTKRQKADQILSRWDGFERPSIGGIQDSYNFLGTVEGSVELPVAPATEEGFLRVQLVPAGGELGRWNVVPSEQKVVADLRFARPRAYRNGEFRDFPLGNSIEFAIYGVTPGKYRVQALWDRKPPFCAAITNRCEPSQGDVVSIHSPLVEVSKGKASRNIQVDCKTVIE
jgi:hypothetical protein